jgi:HPt (histidine-containing phosphotransfer) domain-containing protein
MTQNFQQQMIALRRYYTSQLPDKVIAIDDAWRDYLENPEPDKLRVLFRQTHNLSGSAGTYGYKDISNIAKKLDKILRTNKSLNDENKEQISTLITQLRDICKKLG